VKEGSFDGDGALSLAPPFANASNICIKRGVSDVPVTPALAARVDRFSVLPLRFASGAKTARLKLRR